MGGCLSAATTPDNCRSGGWPTQNQNRIDLSPETAVVFGIPWVGVHGHDAAECCTGRRTEASPTFRTQTFGLGNGSSRSCHRFGLACKVSRRPPGLKAGGRNSAHLFFPFYFRSKIPVRLADRLSSSICLCCRAEGCEQVALMPHGSACSEDAKVWNVSL